MKPQRWARKAQHQDPLADERSPSFDFSGGIENGVARKGGAGMICPTCGSYVPDGNLACTTCVQRKSQAAYVEYQRQFMQQIFAGDLSLRIRKGKAGYSQMHIELFGDGAHTYCGVPTVGLRQSFLIFRGELRAPLDTCPACAQIFERLMNEELDAIPVEDDETQNF
jgi:hypothetical protein